MSAERFPDELDDADNVVELPQPLRRPRKWPRVALRRPSLLRRVGIADVVFLAGLGMVAYGLALVAAPLPFLVLGLMFLAFGSRRPRRAG
ncbi:MAG: hypothetical protein ACYDAK_05290 [Candidatus Limnocylindrales bacterium]